MSFFSNRQQAFLRETVNWEQRGRDKWDRLMQGHYDELNPQRKHQWLHTRGLQGHRPKSSNGMGRSQSASAVKPERSRAVRAPGVPQLRLRKEEPFESLATTLTGYAQTDRTHHRSRPPSSLAETRMMLRSPSGNPKAPARSPPAGHQLMTPPRGPKPPSPTRPVYLPAARPSAAGQHNYGGWMRGPPLSEPRPKATKPQLSDTPRANRVVSRPGSSAPSRLQHPSVRPHSSSGSPLSPPRAQQSSPSRARTPSTSRQEGQPPQISQIPAYLEELSQDEESEAMDSEGWEEEVEAETLELPTGMPQTMSQTADFITQVALSVRAKHPVYSAFPKGDGRRARSPNETLDRTISLDTSFTRSVSLGGLGMEDGTWNGRGHKDAERSDRSFNGAFARTLRPNLTRISR